MRWHLAFVSGLAAFAILGGAARADEPRPLVRLEVDGRCPTAEAVAAELPQDLAEGGWTLRVRHERRAVHVQLVDALGAIQADRIIPGDDCAAIAQAIGAIVEARFLELGTLHAEPAPPAAPPGAPDAAPHPAPPIPVPDAPAEPPAPAAPSAKPPLPPPLRLAPAAPGAAEFGLGIAAGLDFDSTATGAAPGGAIDFSWVTPLHGLRLRGQLSTAGAATLEAAVPARRSPYGVRVDLGPRLGGGRLWLQPALGAAVVVSDVAAEVGTTTRVHAAAAASCTGGVRLGAGVSLRLELGALAFPLADHYRDSEGMDLGRSPRLTVSVGLGLDVALGSQKD